MGKAKEVTTKFRVDLTEFKSGIAQANKDIKLSNAQFKEASAGMDDWASSSDGLSAKISQLNKVLEAEKSKLANYEKQQQATIEKEQEAAKAKEELKQKINALQKEYDDLVKSQGENSDGALELKKSLETLTKEYKVADKYQKINAKSLDDLEIKILNQKGTIKQTEKAINQYDNALNELNASNNKVKSTYEKLEDTIKDQEKRLRDLKSEYSNVVLEQGENSNEAKQLRKSMQDLNKELEENKSTMAKVDGASDKLASGLNKVENAADNSGDGFTIMKGALADLVSNVIQGAVSKIGDLVGRLLDLSEATAEYRSMNAKLEGSAKTFGYSVDFAKGQYEKFYRYLGDDQMATNAITNLMGLGTSTESLSKLAEGATAVWASYGDSIPIESFTEATNETINTAKVTGTFADSINWAKLSNEELAKSFGDGSKAQKAFNKAIEDGETQEDAFSAALAATSDQQERADIVAKFLNDTYGESKKTYDELTGSIQDTKTKELELKETQAELANAIDPVNSAFTEMKNEALQMILPLVKYLAEEFLNLKKYLEEHPGVAKALTVGVIALASAFGVLATALAIQGLISGVTKAIALLNTTLLANPIVLIIAAIAGLVAAFIYLWNNVDGFKQFFIDAWKAIQNAFDVAVEWIKVGLEAVGKFFTETIPQFFQTCIDWIKKNWMSILLFLINPFAGLFKYFYDNNTKFKEFVDNAVNFIKELPGKIWEWLLKTINKVNEWRVNMINKAKETASNFISSVVNFFKTLPGKVWEWLLGVIKKVLEWSTNLVNKAKETARNFVNTIINFVKELPSKIWNSIVGAVSRVAQWGSNLISVAKEKMVNFVSSIASKVREVPTKIYNGLKGAISKVIQWGSNMISTAKSKIGDFVEKIAGWIKELPGKIGDVGKNMVEGIWEGIKGATNWLKEKITSWVGKPIEWAKEILGINSPSRVFRDEIGKFMAMGLGEGFSEEMEHVKKDINNALDFTKDYLNLPNLNLNTPNLANASNSKVVNNYNYEFNQTNNSPEPLDELTIYRQVNNLFTWQRGLVK